MPWVPLTNNLKLSENTKYIVGDSDVAERLPSPQVFPYTFRGIENVPATGPNVLSPKPATTLAVFDYLQPGSLSGRSERKKFQLANAGEYTMNYIWMNEGGKRRKSRKSRKSRKTRARSMRRL
jgi:hypothetical protein